MDSISAIPQQPQLGRLAQFLRALESERPEFLPRQLDVMGLIRQLALPSASTVENLSYGNLPFTMPPAGTGAAIPQVKTGRKPEVADLVGMLGGVPGMGAVADVGTKLSNEAADAIVRAITRNPEATAQRVIQETSMPFMQAVAPKTSQIPNILENKSFRDWFGDSKIVDESGNPMVVYHGSGSKDITEFDPSKYETVLKGDWGKGIYFTPSKWMADSYRQGAIKYSDQDVKKAWENLQDTAKKYGTTDMNSWLDFRAGKITEDQYKDIQAADSKWRDALKSAEQSDKGKVYETYLKMENPYVYTYGGITEPDLATRAKNAGHDGLIIKNESGTIEEIVVFDPKQIKAAKENIGTFDPETANIYRGMAVAPTAGLLGDEGE